MLNFESQWESKGLEIETDIEDGVTVTADGELLALVWNNLISNAVKFTDSGRISISLKRDGDSATVRIADTAAESARRTENIF